MNKEQLNETIRKNCSLLIVHCLIFFLFSCEFLGAQTIKGRITDEKGAAVNSASLFVRELKLGTAANDDGYYELKVQEGAYTCVFQCMGYETETRTITVGNGISEHNIALREKAYEIRELVVSKNREDPAYAIMRRAIAMAPYYLNQVSEYKADVYLKGTLHVGKISALVKRLAKDELNEMNFKEGKTYLEESFSEVEFAVPNKYRQKVIKKTGSLAGENNSNSNNAMSLITSSIYDTKALEPIISPLSTGAFSHYRFRYEGFSNEDNRIINKIKVTPVRKSKQLLSGYIYIADDYWNVYSADLTGEFIMGITFSMQANFGEVNSNIWMPVSYRFTFDASILGNKGSFNYVSSVKYTSIVENKSIRKPDVLFAAEQRRRQQDQLPPAAVEETKPATGKTGAKIENLMENENLSNRQAYQLARLMQKEAEVEKKATKSLDLTESLSREYKITVDSAAGKRDTAYWEMMRPVPLNSDELKSYQEREIKLAAPPKEKDTTQNKKEKTKKSPFISTTGKVLSGTNIKLGTKGKYGTLQYRGLRPSQLGFNTVDGFYIGQKITYNRNFDPKKSVTRLTVVPEVVWAINRKAVMWNVNSSLTYAPMRRGSANIKFGQQTADFSNNRGINAFENTVSSLFFRRNYLKLYENNYVEASNRIDIANGLQLSTALKYARREMLDNHSDYSFFYRDLQYTPNIPSNAELTADPINHKSVVFSLGVNYTPRYYYRRVCNQKRMVKSDYPDFFAGWQKGVNDFWGSNSNFDHIYVGLQQKLEPGLMQEFRYFVRGGMFVNSKRVFFPDFRHFATVEIPVTVWSISRQSFNLLEYYRYSTSDKYLEAHLNYYTPFLALKLLPFLSNRMLWQESLQLNYLCTPNIRNYTELGYTTGIMSMWEAGIFAGFENFRYRSFGVRVSFLIGNIVNL